MIATICDQDEVDIFIDHPNQNKGLWFPAKIKKISKDSIQALCIHSNYGEKTNGSYWVNMNDLNEMTPFGQHKND